MGLDTLPLEILQSVTNELNTVEYGNLRLVCKAIEKQCFDDWAKEYFTTRQFSLTRFSLQALVDISLDVAISPYLHRLILSTDNVELSVPWPPAQGAQALLQYERFIEYQDEQVHFRSTGADHAMLIDAMRRLRNCKTLEIRDYYSRFQGGRTRDNTSWKSYGATTFRKEAGRELTFGSIHGVEQRVSNVFAVAISAAQASQLPLKTFVASLRVHHGLLNLASSVFYIPPAETASYARLLGSLESFTLHVGIHGEITSGPHDLFMRKKTKAFADFMSLAPNLQSLRLNCNDGTPASAFFTEIGPRLPHGVLSCLELGRMRITEDALITLLSRFTALRDVTFFRVGLSEGAWTSLLGEVSSKLASLRSLRLVHVTQTGEYHQQSNVVPVRFNTSDAEVQSFSDHSLVPDCTISDKFDFKSKLDATIPRIVVYDDDFRNAHKDASPSGSEILGSGVDGDSMDDSGEEDFLGGDGGDDDSGGDEDDDSVL
ncbi:hypothetical protein NA57DRAFT_77660 [Rhizodiscina lignyota]|uniref:F-box domain-containing protein n=1 Tax=Rhizodiscina lignyota TaxID=1504668 RepID=A0A9P4IDL8_9PEZI|nr:hypothetical protein NA57DRAFT_77660 [Rhizodiscina lignyota]